MSLVSLKPTNDLFELKYNPFWLQTFTLENYLYLFQSTDFPEWIKNTIIVSMVSRLHADGSPAEDHTPLSTPGLISAGIFCFTLCWNKFLYALIFMSSGPMKTIPVGTVSDLIKADTLFWGSLMASAVLGSFPIAFLYSFFVKYYVSGLTAGAVKR